MAAPHRHVQDAIDRWEAAGLLSPELARRLETEAARHGAGEGRGFAQVLLAATGTVVLVIATVTFFTWVWPVLGEGARTVLVAALGLALIGGGLQAERVPRWRLPGRVLSVAGLVVLAAAGIYSHNAWSNGSAGGLAVGVLALLVPALGLPLSAGRHPVLPVALAASGYLFLFLFLLRGLALPDDHAIWYVDAALAAAGAMLAARLASGRAAPWELHAAAASLYVVPVLILATVYGPLDLRGHAAAWPMAVWWLLSTGLILWALHGAPPALRRDWYRGGLVAAVPLGVGMGFWTTLGALDGPPEAAALAVAALGGAGTAYALREQERSVLVVSALALVVAAWYYGAERAQALGGVAALFATAVLLFWVSGRLGAMKGDA